MATEAERIKSVKVDLFRSAWFVDHFKGAVYENQGVLRVKNLIEVQHILEHARGTILDVGTGSGRIGIPVCDGSHRLIGVDASPRMLAVAQAAAGQRDMAWVAADVEHLAFADESFDTVISINMLKHLPQWKSSLLEFQRVCRKKGRLIFDMCSGDITDMVNRDGVKYGAQATATDASYLAEVPVAQTCAFIEASGMTIDSVIPHGFFNANYWMQEALGERYDSFIERVKRALVESESAFRFWCFVEKHIVSRLPTEACYDYLVVAINGPDGRRRVPKALDAYDVPVGGQGFLRQCLDSDYDWIVHGAASLLRSGEAMRFFELIFEDVFRRLDPDLQLVDFVPDVVAEHNRLRQYREGLDADVTRWAAALDGDAGEPSRLSAAQRATLLEYDMVPSLCADRPTSVPRSRGTED
jgi:2-polyprenyl-3-methyl-5-hydroxy-6-metoxy-1,4-benzoquinol methylase